MAHTRMLSRRCLCTLPALPALLALGIDVPCAHASAATMYTDAGSRFTFTAPDSWTAYTPGAPTIAAIYTASDPYGFFLVGVYSAAGASLDAGAMLAMNGTAKNVAGYTFIQSQDATLGGEPAREMTYSGTNQGVDYNGTQRVALHNGDLYVVTFGALPGDIDAFNTQAAVPLTSWVFL